MDKMTEESFTERKVVFGEDDLPVDFCIIKESGKEFCIKIDNERFINLFQEDLDKALEKHWEETKEERERTHTSRIFEKKFKK